MAPLGNAPKDLSADSLFRSLRSRFDSLPDPRPRSEEIRIPLGDALMSAFAMFSLKGPSLLAFDHRRRDPLDNSRSIYGIDQVPCDSQLRDILDPPDPDHLRSGFRDVSRRLQRGKALGRFVDLDGCYLLSLDGTTYFSSSKIPCPSCLQRHHRGGGITYSHQLPGATLVHPDLKEVIPLAPEPIIQQDGQTKNDRESRCHPPLAPAVPPRASPSAGHRRRRRPGRRRPSPGGPARPACISSSASSRATTPSCSSTCGPVTRPAGCKIVTGFDPATGVLHHFRPCHAAPLNESHPDESVNVPEYWEVHPDGEVQHFSRITDFVLTSESVRDIMRGGRARWEIENETFNTLKNQGYNPGHNDGHGERNLSVVLALLMMPAFLVDQVQQMSCPVFQAAWQKMKTECHLREEIRHHFRTLRFDTMAELLEALVRGIVPQEPVLQNTS